jgi:BNR repeat-containing family member
MGYLLLALLAAAGLVVTAVALHGRHSPSPALPDLHNGQTFIQDDLWSTANEQYAVWIGPDGTPYAGKRARAGGAWQVANLAAIPGNPLHAPVAADEHNVLAVGVDSLGYVHVAGNMHLDPMRYIRSARPGDITSWQVGALPDAAPRVTYPAFVGLPDGTLQFWRREGISGDGAEVADVLAPGATVWRPLVPGRVVVDGRGTGESPYLHHIAVDPRTGAIHLLFEWRRDGPDPSTTNDVSYARSLDGGHTWQTSTGRPIPTPITHASAERVIDTAPTGSGLVNDGGLTVDAAGNPHGIVVFEPPRGARSLDHVWHDGAGWHQERLPGGTVLRRPSIAGGRDGTVWLIGVTGPDDRLTAVQLQPGGRREDLGPVPPDWEASYDSQLLQRTGQVEMLVPAGATPRVVDFKP